MKENYTHIVLLLDRSGSMASIQDATISGINEFLTKQKAVPGDATVTLALFDDRYDLIHDFVPLNDVPALTRETFVPRGWTALLDATGKTLNNVGSKLAALPEALRPSKVIFVIVTDGAENYSKEFNLNQVRSMITTQRDTYSWEFVFLGANIDAVTVGGSLGIPAMSSMTYNANVRSVGATYTALNAAIGSSRSLGITSNFTDAQRKAILQADSTDSKDDSVKTTTTDGSTT